MTPTRNEPGCLGLLGCLAIAVVIMFIIEHSLDDEKEACRERGGTPFVDRQYDVVCLEPKEGR